MAYYKKNDCIKELFTGVNTWLKLSLVEGKSVFSGKNIWTQDNILSLEEWFSNSLDTGEGNFFEKLEIQISECAPEVKQLAAEMLWLMLLCPRNISPGKKRESIIRIWNWSGDKLSDSHPLLSNSTLAGVGSAGTSFNTNRWRELVYCIEVFKLAFQMNSPERLTLFSNYNQLASWLSKISESEKRQFRHMLLYMLHPDYIERIFSSGQRRAIVHKFTGKPARVVNKLTAYEIDKEIFEIRLDKENEFGLDGLDGLDFYDSPLKELWKDQATRSWLFAWNPNSWAWGDLSKGIEQTKQSKSVTLRWSCANKNVLPGDRAWLVRLGEEPKGIIASGNVVSEPYEAEHYNQERAQKGDTCQYVDIELVSIRDVSKESFVTMEDLNGINTEKQQWSPQSSGIEIKPRSAAQLNELWEKTLNSSNSQTSAPSQFVIAEPTNKILYGPPGTGKTYALNKLKENYIVKQASISFEQWLLEKLKQVSWFDVVFMCLYDLRLPAKVKDIENHPFFIQKAKAAGRREHLKAQIWATLQTHTVDTSSTVNYKNRVAPLVFDKTEESRWLLAGNWQEECEDLIQQAEVLKKGVPSQADLLNYAFVTFHQAYSYEDFVEGIRPVQDSDTGQLTYRVEPGIFRQICHDAKNNPNTRFALFVDEINRGNIAKIFGELITLIEPDKRAVYDDQDSLISGMELTLPYSRERFGVPKNLDIYGTMNTADRSIALLDTALRRRFLFEELMPNAKLISGSKSDGRIEAEDGIDIDLRALLDVMNLRIRFLLNRDLTLGHAYFYRVKSFESLRDVFLNQIIPLLQEYFYNDWHRIQLVFCDIGQDNQPIEPQIIEHRLLKSSDILGFDYDEFEDMIDYEVAALVNITPEAIRKIYEPQE